MEPQSDEDATTDKRARRVGPTSRGASSYTRKRAVAACQVCRSRRTKCDNKKPKCSFCERTGAECVMTPDSMSTFDPASLRILERLDELQNQLQESIRANTQPNLGDTQTVTVLARPQHRTFSGHLEDVLDWPVVNQYKPRQPELLTNTYSATPYITSAALELNIELDLETCDALLDNFFHFVHIKNPVLDEQKTRQMIKNVFSEGVGWDSESCLALIICANGAISRSFFSKSLSSSDINRSHGPALFQAAQNRLGIVMAHDGLATAQCLFFFGVYRMCTLQPHGAWRMFLQALAACQQFKFLTGTSEPGTPTNVAHAEECIYWSCWKSERELRWILKLPDFGELAYDHPKSFPSLPEGLCEEEQLEAWYFYLSEISLWRLSTRAGKDIEISTSHPETILLDNLVDLSKELEEKALAWSQSLAPVIRLDGSSDQESEVLRFILRGHITSYYEMIWWPFVEAAVNQSNTSPIVISCATKGLRNHLDCLTINRPGFYYRHHGTWLLQQSCIRSALVLLASSKIDSSAHILPTGWETAVHDTIDMLRYWRRDDASISSGIIALLESMSGT